MTSQAAVSAELTIKNLLGFHVRPIQRFAELARVFRSDIEVEVEDRKASGKSVMGLMSLGARHRSIAKITATGEDAHQAVGVLSFLVESTFFVEDDPGAELHPDRHVMRLAKIASCFNSELSVELCGQRADVQDFAEVLKLGLKPTSDVKFHAHGEDAQQALKVLKHLAERCFYIEEEMSAKRKRN